MRNTYTMTGVEVARFNRLRPFPGEALSFWAKVAVDRGVDSKSMITAGHQGTFTALPVNHGDQWCFPFTLKCTKKPSYKD